MRSQYNLCRIPCTGEGPSYAPRFPRAHKTLRAKVRKIIRPAYPTQPEKAEISIDEADDLYREIRIENRLMDEKGKEARLKQGAEVEVQIGADKEATRGKT